MHDILLVNIIDNFVIGKEQLLLIINEIDDAHQMVIIFCRLF